MAKSDISGLLMIVLFLAASGWTVCYILFHDEFYKGEPILAHKVVLSDDMRFSSDDGLSYYFFTVEEYKAVLRMKNGAYNVLKSDTSLENRVKSLKYQDTLDIMLRVADNRNLFRDKKIEVIGLSVNDTLLIDPAMVKEADRREKRDSGVIKWTVVALIGIILFRKYKRERRKTSGTFQSDDAVTPSGRDGD
ncbi:MAG: hypothetical protein DI535_01510 [Citrobacter freundii]|nr:MAG: hypothetical protein DI535_01510 [Citrobacter freundii]